MTASFDPRLVRPVTQPGSNQLPTRAPTDARAARKAAGLLEGLFMRELMRSLRRTVPRGGILSGGFAQQTFSEMLDGAISQNAGKRSTLGLANQIWTHLLTKEAAASTVQTKSTNVANVRPSVRLPVPIATTHRRAVSPRRPEAVTLRDADGELWSPTRSPLHIDSDGRITSHPDAAVTAVASGEVTDVGTDFLTLRHANGLSSHYTALGSTRAERGDLILRGQQLGAVGSSGSFILRLFSKENALPSAILKRKIRQTRANK